MPPPILWARTQNDPWSGVCVSVQVSMRERAFACVRADVIDMLTRASSEEANTPEA